MAKMELLQNDQKICDGHPKIPRNEYVIIGPSWPYLPRKKGTKLGMPNIYTCGGKKIIYQIPFIISNTYAKNKLLAKSFLAIFVVRKT